MEVAFGRTLTLKAEAAQDRQLVARMQAAFTFENPAYTSAASVGASTKGIPPTMNCWHERRDGAVSFPRAALSLEQFIELGGVVEKAPALDPSFPASFTPREGQEEAIGAMVDALCAYPFGGILEAPCGTGKTVMGIEVIRRLGCPTAVLVHKSFLMEQWAERIAEFLPQARIGFLRGDAAATGDDHDVVICMIQSLLAREYDREVYESFGLVLSDEVHRLGAAQWQQVIHRFSAPRRLGLSATPHRKDGLTRVFVSAIGPIAHKMEVERRPPRLEVVRLQTSVNPREYTQSWGSRRPMVGKLVTLLSQREERTTRIVTDAARAVKAGRKVLVLTARVDHVNKMVGSLSMLGIDASRYTGGMKPEEQERATDSDVVVGTYPMAQEGLDVPAFDTLLLATPQSEVEQAVGRILREHDGKRPPLVVDYVDVKVGLCKGLFRSRSKVYARLGVGMSG